MEHGQADQGPPPQSDNKGAFSKPHPRPGKSPAHSATIRKQNRRHHWLERHPEYFKSLEHELADPLLYDALIRRFQSAAEREAEGRSKGYSRVLEVDLLRGEAKLSELARSGPDKAALEPERRLDALGLVLSPEELRPKTQEEGRAMWERFLHQRFVKGADEDFDYRVPDEDDALDVEERQEAQDAWFEDEEPGWASDAAPEAGGIRKPHEGETGIQDF